MWYLPTTVKTHDINFNIRNECDYRIVLDVINVIEDKDFTADEIAECTLMLFYENIEQLNEIEDDIERSEALQYLFEEMFKIINLGEVSAEKNTKPAIMNWSKDFKLLVSPISRVIGYDVRKPEHTHWWTFVGAYMEIGDCSFANIVSIRNKRYKGKKLEKWEEEFYRENRELIDLPYNLAPEDEEFLNFDI